MAKFNPSRAVALIASGEITEVVGVPAVYRALLSAIGKHGHSVDTARGALRLCVCGGSPLPVSLQERWYDATGVELRQGYGLTEAGPVCLFNRVDHPNVRGSLGLPYPGVDVRLGDESEILVRGDNVFRGYVSGGENGLRVSDGWLHTGDIGSRGERETIGFLMVQKEMFTRNGFNIYPRELERVIRELPGVDEVAIVSTAPPEKEMEIVVALRGGTATPNDVRAWCAQQLSAYKQPQFVGYFEDFTSASG